MSGQIGILGLIYEYLPSIVITAGNFLVPLLCEQIALVERYPPSTTVILALLRFGQRVCGLELLTAGFSVTTRPKCLSFTRWKMKSYNRRHASKSVACVNMNTFFFSAELISTRYRNQIS